MTTTLLRPLADADLDALFVWESDPRAVELAAFTRADPSDREVFDEHKTRIRANPENTVLAIDERSRAAKSCHSRQGGCYRQAVSISASARQARREPPPRGRDTFVKVAATVT